MTILINLSPFLISLIIAIFLSILSYKICKIRHYKVIFAINVLFIIPIFLSIYLVGNEQPSKILCEQFEGELFSKKCHLPTHDYKKSCNTNQECEGQCVADVSNKTDWRNMPSKGKGICSKFNNPCVNAFTTSGLTLC